LAAIAGGKKGAEKHEEDIEKKSGPFLGLKNSGEKSAQQVSKTADKLRKNRFVKDTTRRGKGGACRKPFSRGKFLLAPKRGQLTSAWETVGVQEKNKPLTRKKRGILVGEKGGNRDFTQKKVASGKGAREARRDRRRPAGRSPKLSFFSAISGRKGKGKTELKKAGACGFKRDEEKRAPPELRG